MDLVVDYCNKVVGLLIDYLFFSVCVAQKDRKKDESENRDRIEKNYEKTRKAHNRNSS